MAHLIRVKAAWSGFQGAPGLTVFHFSAFDVGAGWLPADSQSAVDRVRSFFFGCGPSLPAGVVVQVGSETEIIESTDNSLVEIHAVTAPAPVNGSATGTSYASPVGAVVNWRTNEIRKGRRIRGRSFIVPLAGSAFEANGTLSASTITNVQGAATTLRTAAGNARMGVYARPSTKDATDGLWAQASANSVPDMGAVLRSRRD